VQRRMLYLRRSEDEEIKEAGLKIDFDEIARRGSMSKEEKNIAKWYGVYGSKHPGNHMARVVIPGGVITSTQARNISEVAEKYGQGKLNITTRQAIQFHWLKVEALADMMRDLARRAAPPSMAVGTLRGTLQPVPWQRPVSTPDLMSAAMLSKLPSTWEMPMTWRTCPGSSRLPIRVAALDVLNPL
jgi:hypothetical protein